MKLLKFAFVPVLLLAIGASVAASNTEAKRINGFQKTVANQSCLATTAVPSTCSDVGNVICTAPTSNPTTVYYIDSQCLEFYLRP